MRQKGKDNKAAMDAANSILVLACGTGAQTIGDTLGYRVHPGSESLFVGEVQFLGNYVEKCSTCGVCVLEMTEGICPITRCSKGLLNGPCGGSKNGKCEIDPEKDCAWVLIYNRLKERGKLGIPIMVGIVLLKGAGMAKYMNANVPGVVVPEAMIKELTETPKGGAKQKSVEIAARLIREMKPMCQGAHIMPLGWDDAVLQVVAAAGLR